MAKVLVLNQDYQAISLCEPNRALILVMLKKAELISDVSDRKFRSINQEFRFPSIIRLYAYVHVPYKKVAMTRHNIFKRDGNQCVYCGHTDNLTLDHIIPRAKGGRSTWDNLVTACQRCNSQKGDRTPEEAGLAMRFTPFRPSFIMYLSRFSSRVNEDWKPYLFMN